MYAVLTLHTHSTLSPQSKGTGGWSLSGWMVQGSLGGGSLWPVSQWRLYKTDLLVPSKLNPGVGGLECSPVVHLPPFNAMHTGSQHISGLLLPFLLLHDPRESFTPSCNISMLGEPWARAAASQLMPLGCAIWGCSLYLSVAPPSKHACCPWFKGELFTG